jgi:acyl carrier protein
LSSAPPDLRERLAVMIEGRVGASRQALLADTAFADLGHDSLAVLEIGFYLEQELGIDMQGEINGKNLPRNLSDLAAVIAPHLREGA